MTSDVRDDDLRARLDRLVPTPDDVAGWTGVRRGVQRARQRRRGLVVAGASAALAVALVGGVLVASAGQTGDQRLRTASPPVTTTPNTPTTYASLPIGPGSTPGTILGRPTGAGQPAVGASVPGGSPSGHPGATTAPLGLHTTGGTSPGATLPPNTAASTPVPPTQPGTTVTSGSQPTSTEPTDTSVAPVSIVNPPTATGLPATNSLAPAPLTIDQVQDAIERFVAPDADQVRSVSQSRVAGRSVVTVALRADAQALAQEITSLWPSQTVVRVGFFVYGATSAPDTNACPAVSTAGPTGLSLSATAALNPSPIPTGDDFTGTLAVTNHGPDPVSFTSTLSTTVVLLPPGSSQVVGCFDGPTSAVPVHGVISPGQSANFTLSGGTASADRDLGYALPAGLYVGLVHITIGGQSVPFTFPVSIGGS